MSSSLWKDLPIQKQVVPSPILFHSFSTLNPCSHQCLWLIKEQWFSASVSFNILQKVLKTLMIRPKPRSMKSESLNVGPRHQSRRCQCRQGWKGLLQKAGPVPPWRMVHALDHKLEEGCREAGACAKNSDQESEESAFRYKGPGKGYGGDSGAYKWLLRVPNAPSCDLKG